MKTFLAACTLLALSLTACGRGGGAPSTPLTVTGKVLGSPMPVSGALVQTPDGAVSTRTNGEGEFTITLPAGIRQVVVDGTRNFDPADNSMQLPARARFLLPVADRASGNGFHFGSRPLFLPTVTGSRQFPLDADRHATVPAGTDIKDPSTGTSFLFAQSTTVTFPEGSDGTMSLAVIASEEAPVQMPHDRTTARIVALQPPGMAFSQPVQMTLPNWNGLAAGTTGVELRRLDERTNLWQQFGTGTVDAGGDTVVADATAQLKASGFVAGLTAIGCTTTVTGRVVDASNPSTGIADVAVITAGGALATTDATGAFSIAGVRLPNNELLIAAYAAPLTQPQGFDANLARAKIVACNGATDMGTIELQPDPASTSTLEIVSAVPADGDTDVGRQDAIQITFTEKLSPSSIDAGTLRVAVNGSFISGSYGVNGKVATFVPSQPMPAAARGTITVSIDVKDSNGSALATEFASSFTTADSSGGSASLVVTGTTTAIVGQTSALDAVVSDGAGTHLPGMFVQWSTSDPAIANVSPTGLVTGVAVGSTTISASSGLMSDTLAFTVTAPTLAAVDVAPSVQTLVVGALRTLTAIAHASGGSIVANVPIAWSSSDSSIATVDADGNVRAIAAGSATVTATAFSVADTTAITVVAHNQIASIQVSPTARTMSVGASASFLSTARLGNSAIVPGVAVAWSSSEPSVVSINQAGQAMALATGSATITAAAHGLAGTTMVTVGPTTALTVLLSGFDRANDPISQVRVLRHDPVTGAFLEERTTDGNGIAAFGDIGSATTTITIVLPIFFGLEFVVWENIPTGTHRFGVAQSNLGWTLAATASNIASSGRGYASFADYGTTTVAGADVMNGVANFFNVPLPHLQIDGLTSVLVIAGDTTAAAPIHQCGYALDFDPATLSAPIPVDLSTGSLTNIAWSSPSGVLRANTTYRRRGSLHHVETLAIEPATATSGVVQVCDLPGRTAVAQEFNTMSSPGTGRTYVWHGELPAQIDVTMPDAAIAALAWQPATNTITWQQSGGDIGSFDCATIGLNWQVGGTFYRYRVHRTTATTSAMLAPLAPDLPVLTANDQVTAYSVVLEDYDNLAGFAEFFARLQQLEGNERQLLFTANQLSTASQLLHTGN